MAVAAGGFHSLGLKADGSIVGWGLNGYGDTTVPAPNTGFVSVAAGGFHSLGLKANGSIVGWGDNSDGQTSVPPPNRGFVSVAGGGAHSLGLKADGSIVAWGSNNYGQTNVPDANTGFVAVAAGAYHSLGLKTDGSIVAWGCGSPNNQGQCNVPAPNADFISIAAGLYHSLGLKADGSIVAWGCGAGYDDGQCNVPFPNTGFVAVAAGGWHNLGLKGDGSIVGWGSNDYGEISVPSPNTGFVAIAGGGYHSLGLKSDGSIVAWGNIDYGLTNVPAPNADFIGIATGWAHSLGLKTNGSIVGWGYNGNGQTNIPPPNTGFVAIDAGSSHSLGVRCPSTIVALPDITGDDATDLRDVAALYSLFGSSGAESRPADLDGDGRVTLGDWKILASDLTGVLPCRALDEDQFVFEMLGPCYDIYLHANELGYASYAVGRLCEDVATGDRTVVGVVHKLCSSDSLSLICAPHLEQAYLIRHESEGKVVLFNSGGGIRIFPGGAIELVGPDGATRNAQVWSQAAIGFCPDFWVWLSCVAITQLIPVGECGAAVASCMACLPSSRGACLQVAVTCLGNVAAPVCGQIIDPSSPSPECGDDPSGRSCASGTSCGEGKCSFGLCWSDGSMQQGDDCTAELGSELPRCFGRAVISEARCNNGYCVGVLPDEPCEPGCKGCSQGECIPDGDVTCSCPSTHHCIINWCNGQPWHSSVYRCDSFVCGP